jgi:parallel beta-helix repeat protein
VQSVNGALFTGIAGAAAPSPANENLAVRCVYLGNGAKLIGFTLSNGHTLVTAGSQSDKSGGAAYAWGAELRDCDIRSNTAALYGGGVYGGTVNNCTILGNVVYGGGGGVHSAMLNNCTLRGNSALDGEMYGSAVGGGAALSWLVNCTVLGNLASYGGGGTYGGTLSNCVVGANSGPRYGGGVCGSTVMSCTLTNNQAQASEEGGGAYQGWLANCTLRGNTSTRGGGAARAGLRECSLASNSAIDSGGGVFESGLTNCVLFGNSATEAGGAMHGSLVNCTLYGNSALTNGGASSATLHNCIAYYNLAPLNPDLNPGDYSFTCSPLLSGNGCITNNPQFVNAPAGNLRLQPGSPCRNVGGNLVWMNSSVDLDGHPRISDGIVDMGAYESGAVSLPAFMDIRLVSGQSHMVLRWVSEAGASYRIHRANDLTAVPSWSLLASNLAATPPLNTYTDFNATALSHRRFYLLQQTQ